MNRLKSHADKFKIFATFSRQVSIPCRKHLVKRCHWSSFYDMEVVIMSTISHVWALVPGIVMLYCAWRYTARPRIPQSLQSLPYLGKPEIHSYRETLKMGYEAVGHCYQAFIESAC
jgi:hypothetical protein